METDLQTTPETHDQLARDSAAAYDRLWQQVQDIEAMVRNLQSSVAQIQEQFRSLPATPSKPPNCPKCGTLKRTPGTAGERSCDAGCGGPLF